MKVIVTKYLNVRVGAPSLNAVCYQYLAPGSELDVDGHLYKGDWYDGIDTWLKDEAGNYYWSGGVKNLVERSTDFSFDFQNFLNASFNGQVLKNPIDYLSLLEIDESFKSGKGQNVTIAILDHPISTSIVLNKDIARPFHVKDPLLNFHGNFIVGIIAGINKILGISNKASIVELPIYDEIGNSSDSDIETALKFINEQDHPMILNISNGLDSRHNEAIRNLRKDIIVVACAGIDGELTRSTIRNPASLENVIAVGAVNSTASLSALNEKVEFVVPNFNFVSFSRNDTLFSYKRGDSFSCAVLSSVIALIISSGKATYNVESVREQLKKISIPFKNTLPHNSFNLYSV